MFRVKDVSNTTTHSRSKVSSGFSENYHTSASHVFASVITHSFNYGCHSRITNAETFSRLTTNKGFTGCCSIEGNVSNNNIVFWFEGRFFIGVHDEFSARQTFSEVVIGFTLQFECHPRGNKCSETLTRRTFELELNSIRW